MRSPILIAETPFANGHGPRFLAPPSREVDADVASYYIGRVREVEQDVEEVEGDDYLAVRLPLQNETNGVTAPEILVLAGIDVDRMSSQERDDVLEQLRERLEVLNDAVAAVDWSIQGYAPVVEIPELEEWHEPSWDALPRSGPWADPEATEAEPEAQSESNSVPEIPAFEPVATDEADSIAGLTEEPEAQREEDSTRAEPEARSEGDCSRATRTGVEGRSLHEAQSDGVRVGFAVERITLRHDGDHANRSIALTVPADVRHRL